MKKRLLITALLLSLAITPFNQSTINAATTEQTVVPQTIQPRGNQTGYKYKSMNGKLYKRLWSYTYNRWEDPEWTLV